MITHVKIGCFNYEVSEVESVNKFEPRKGEIDFFKRTIKIDRDLTDQDKQESLFHEIIHGIDEFMSIGLKEEQVKRLGAALVMVLVDNPSLLNIGSF